MGKILVVDDDQDINRLISTILKKKGHDVTSAYSGTEAELLINMNTYDLVILDLMLPGLTGEEVIERLRKVSNIPVIVLSAKGAMEDKVEVLNLGADDYITKPFENEEIIARVNSQLRRYTKLGASNDIKNDTLMNCDDKSFSDITNSNMSDSNMSDTNSDVIYKNIHIQSAGREVFIKGEQVSFTAHEFDIMLLLFSNPSKVYSREMLYQSVWKNGYYGEDNTVNVHVSNIRKKIAEHDTEEYIKTVWGIGFKAC
ncbi:MAG: response regulator transcription factor [Lachnospiraceae bacterium]|nr:response regulator transcription factor [Lachnospiraceae bacterium]